MTPRNLNDLAPFLFVVCYVLLGALIPITLRTGLLFPGRPGGRADGVMEPLITRPCIGATPETAFHFWPQYKF